MDKSKIEKLQKLPFEDALEKLENTVGEMENGNLPLEEMMKRYEEGQALAEICGQKLKSAEKKIEKLKKKSDDSPEWEHYDKEESQMRNAPSDDNSDTEDDLLF
jgi:exodeoxyribonuclease VII small subunit